MRALITGGCGFLGSAIARELVYQGFGLTILDLPDSRFDNLQGLEYKFISADIRDKEQLRIAVKGQQWVFHTAALVSFWSKRNALQYDINVNGTRALMRACLEAGVERIVHTSTVNALGFPEDPAYPADEETPFNWEPYHIGYMDSKHAAEQAILEMVREQGLPAVIVNPGTIFGPNTSPNLSTNEYIINVVKGKILAYPAGGTNCVGLDDEVRGHILAAEKGKVGERYIIGGENYLYREIFEMIAEETGTSPPRFPAPYFASLAIAKALEVLSNVTGQQPLLTPEMIKAANVCNFYSSQKAIDALGYTFKPFRDVLKETVKYLKDKELI